MDKKPLVSILLPTYNRAHLVPRAIESVLNQSYSYFELIVIDDGSKDDTAEVVGRYVSKDKRIIYIKNNVNLNKSRSLNIGMARSQGDFLTFLDDDAEFVPQKIEQEVSVMQSLSPAPDMIIGNMWVEREKGKAFFPLNLPSQFLSMKDILGSRYSTGNPSALFCARACMKNLNGFDEDAPPFEDGDIVWRACRAGEKIYFYNQPLAIKHITPGLSTITFKYLEAKEKFLKNNIIFLKDHPRYLSRFYYFLGKDYARLGGFKKAGRFFGKAFWFNPWKVEYFFRMIYLLFRFERE
jgi:glycosyltransferase involved in cell wall biosynthesis